MKVSNCINKYDLSNKKIKEDKKLINQREKGFNIIVFLYENENKSKNIGNILKQRNGLAMKEVVEDFMGVKLGVFCVWYKTS